VHKSIVEEVLEFVERISALDFSNPRMEDFDELLRILGYES
jgi:hypothetical protein